MNKQRGFTAPELVVVLWFAVILVAIGGWVANIVKLASMCCDVSGWLILRSVGIVIAPLGAVLGFL